MNSELQAVPNTDLSERTQQPTFSQVGDKNIQIAQAKNVSNVVNIIVPGMSHSLGNMVNTNVALSTEYFNLFVIGCETFSDGHFIVPKDRALTESMSQESKTQFSDLNVDAISQIRTFPSLFASENMQYGKTAADHQAYFGLVTDVKIQDNGIKIYFHALSPVPQQRINNIASSLALQSASSFNELNRTHWAIKRINLIEELRCAGISVLAPT